MKKAICKFISLIVTVVLINNYYFTITTHAHSDSSVSTNIYELEAPYVLLSEGNDSNIFINCDTLEGQGTIASNNTIELHYKTNNLSGKIDEYSECFSLTGLSDVISSDQTKQVDWLKINSHIQYEHVLKLDNIIKPNDIYINAKSIYSINNISVFSSNGNININADSINIKGIIYAPYGEVSIESKNMYFEGLIIAKNISISSERIIIKQNNEIYTEYERKCLAKMTYYDELLTRYQNICSDLSQQYITDDKEKENLRQEQCELYDLFKEKELLATENDINIISKQPAQLFNNNQKSMSYYSNTSCNSPSYPLYSPELDAKYLVTRYKYTNTISNKRYTYYVVSVSGKNQGDTNFTKSYATSVVLQGKIMNEAAATNFINKELVWAFEIGIGCFAAPSVSFAISAIINALNLPKEQENYIITSGDALRITDVNTTTHMRYTFVKDDNGIWHNVYNTNRVEFQIKSQLKYINALGKIDYKDYLRTYSVNGDYYNPERAVDYYVYNCNNNGGTYEDPASLLPYAYSIIPALIIHDVNGKKYKFTPKAYTTTTSLISIL